MVLQIIEVGFVISFFCIIFSSVYLVCKLDKEKDYENFDLKEFKKSHKKAFGLFWVSVGVNIGFGAAMVMLLSAIALKN